MRLIDADILHKRMQEEIRDLLTDADRECMKDEKIYRKVMRGMNENGSY